MKILKGLKRVHYDSAFLETIPFFMDLKKRYCKDFKSALTLKSTMKGRFFIMRKKKAIISIL